MRGLAQGREGNPWPQVHVPRPVSFPPFAVICLLDTNKDLAECSKELGGVQCEQLLTPLTRFNLSNPKAKFAIDNGAFSRWDSQAFLNLLGREYDRVHQCRFVCAPDVVGSARRTLEAFNYWYDRLKHWPVALVAQDGLEDHPIPWDKIRAVFIGGTTEWKLGPHAAAVIKTAKLCGKWVHVGRVSTEGRWRYFEELGADSVDGSALALFKDRREQLAEKLKQHALPI